MQTAATKSMTREFRLVPSGTGQGVSCDVNGAFVGAVPLLKRSRDERRWEPRDCEQLSKQLGADFGLPIDISSKLGGLKAICDALNDGDIARAQISTVLLAIPIHRRLRKARDHGKTSSSSFAISIGAE
jgi:hypothetical protein